MLRLIKWLFFVSLFIALVYGVSFFMSLDEEVLAQTKKDALVAIDTGEVRVFTGPLAEKMREDLQKKKTGFFEMAREKIRKLIGDDK